MYSLMLPTWIQTISYLMQGSFVFYSWMFHVNTHNFHIANAKLPLLYIWIFYVNIQSCFTVIVPLFLDVSYDNAHFYIR